MPGQLVLSRKPGERIFVDGPCIITLVRVGPNSARIGIEADPNVLIRREEVSSDPQIQAARKLGCISCKDIPQR